MTSPLTQMAWALRTLENAMYPTANNDALNLRPTIPPNAGDVVAALRRAADETGADFRYLLDTAMRESSLNPKAQAPSSSATGLFQFIEQTWLGTVKKHGAEHGLGAFAAAISVGNNGRYGVADPALKQEILALRKDAQVAALMAGEMTNAMRGDMEAALGRGVSAGELYVAHFLGPQAAIKMIKAAEATPKASAADMFPQAAAANRSIFYADGRERHVGDVLGSLKAKHGDAPIGDTMLAAADTTAKGWAPPREFEPAQEMAATAINRLGEQATVLAPIMVQILASLDPTPGIAAILGEDEPKLRKSEDDLI